MDETETVTITMSRGNAATLRTLLVLASADQTMAAIDLPQNDPARKGHWALRDEIHAIGNAVNESMKITVAP